MKVKIQIKHPEAVLPKKAHKGDFAYDVVAVSEEEVAPNVWKYGLGLAFQIDREPVVIAIANSMFPEPLPVVIDAFDLDIDFRPRSSVWETGMVLSNCEGTLDEIFTGEVSAVFYHVFPNMPRYKVGDRIGQIKIGITLPMEFEVVDELDSTDRGDRGYGSTGR